MAISYYLITNVLLVLNSLSFNIATRPINLVTSINYANEEFSGTIDIISLAAIKSELGPSPEGKGHGFTNDKILGEMKNSGPSPGGKGHGFCDAETLEHQELDRVQVLVRCWARGKRGCNF
ncbi:hypothetical protein L1887_11701 [Cichorium endivia]|nr:hypothetical protein L1887_11701 [Cichorium endivia]